MIRTRIVKVKLGSTQGRHDGIKDTKLSGRQGTNHDATGKETHSAQIDEANFTSNVHETRHHGSVATGTLLVDLAEEGIGGVTDNGRSDTGNDTREQGNAQSGRAADFGRRLAHAGVDGIGGGTLHDKLGARVGDLFGQDGSQAGVKSADTFFGSHLTETIHQSVGPFGVRDGTNADGLERTEKEIGNELGTGSGSNVDARLVVVGLLFSKVRGSIDLEEFDSSEFEPSLDEVSDGRGAETGRQGHGAFLGDDLVEASNETAVVLRIALDTIQQVNEWPMNLHGNIGLERPAERLLLLPFYTSVAHTTPSISPTTHLDRIELDARLDHVHRRQCAVRNGATNAARRSSLEVVHETILLHGRSQEDGSGCSLGLLGCIHGCERKKMNNDLSEWYVTHEGLAL